MGIPLDTKRRRRSYANYKPGRERRRPSNDPLRILIYLIIIGGSGWVLFNQETITPEIQQRVDNVSNTVRPTPRPTADPTEVAIQAEEAYNSGNLQRAVELYGEAADIDPSNVEFHFQQARLLIFMSAMEYDPAERERLLEDAFQAANDAKFADATRPEGYAILGKAYDWAGDPERAITEINRAIDLDEEYALSYAYLAEAYVELDRWDQALETIETAISLDPDDPDIRRDFGWIYENFGDWFNASIQYELAIEGAPSLAYLRVALARTYRQEGRYNEALDQLFEAQELNPQNPVIAFQIGLTYESFIGNQESAIEAYQSATELDPNYGTPWFRLGEISYYRLDWPNAIEAHSQALELGVDSVNIPWQLGISFVNEGRCSEALPFLRQTIGEIDAFAEASRQAIVEQVNLALETCEQPTVVPPTPIPAPDN
ncbi:MAG: tetratricopeptide repeat protein [Chloroflexi bacterium]|nr:tetratricopeptide repeat protein [Chloroflexota bacterium]